MIPEKENKKNKEENTPIAIAQEVNLVMTEEAFPLTNHDTIMENIKIQKLNEMSDIISSSLHNVKHSNTIVTSLQNVDAIILAAYNEDIILHIVDEIGKNKTTNLLEAVDGIKITGDNITKVIGSVQNYISTLSPPSYQDFLNSDLYKEEKKNFEETGELHLLSLANEHSIRGKKLEAKEKVAKIGKDLSDTSSKTIKEISKFIPNIPSVSSLSPANFFKSSKKDDDERKK